MIDNMTVNSLSAFGDDTVTVSSTNVGTGDLFACSVTSPVDFGFPSVGTVTATLGTTTPSLTLGRKFDHGKLQYGLLPPNAIEATVEILTFGAEKYEPDNWKWVPDAKRRYFDALNRHLWAWKKGEQNDQETGKNHLAHALCCLMFLYEHDTIDFSNDEDVK